MKAKLLHHLGAPCVAQIRPPDDRPTTGSRMLYRNPEALVRHEPGGAVITPPNLYAAFIHVDESLADALREQGVAENQLDNETLALLTENAVLLEKPSATMPRQDMVVDCPGLPPQTLLDVTSACNCACEACYHIEDLHGYQPPLEDVLRRIDKLAELGTCLFEVTGGEPTLRPDLPEILDHIYAHGLHYYVVTNGSRLNVASPRLLETLQLGLGLAVSLDGVGATHDRIRRLPGLYDNLMAGLEELRGTGIKTYFIATVHANNLDQIDALIEVAKSFDTTVHLRPAIRTGNAARNALPTANRAALMARLGHQHVRNGLLATKKTIPRALNYGCGIRKRISVSATGILHPCVMDRTRALADIESYDRRSLVAALEEEAKRFLSANSKCTACERNPSTACATCGGFCRFSCAYEQGTLL